MGNLNNKEQKPHNVPKNADLYRGEFILFFSEEENPEILYHTIIAEEAYKKAEEIYQQSKRKPLVIRVGIDEKENMAQFLATRF